MGPKASHYLVAEGKLHVPAGKRTQVTLIGAIPLCFLIFSKTVHSFVRQLQYIRFVATGFGFYKTIFRLMLTTGRYIQCVHTLWGPIVLILKIIMNLMTLCKHYGIP